MTARRCAARRSTPYVLIQKLHTSVLQVCGRSDSELEVSRTYTESVAAQLLTQGVPWHDGQGMHATA